ncbi:MAG: cation:proton antiporter family protein [Candidatus Levybacteria bacterium]|nr:cation:proton antiporter family protein [Candidatus Levybacteria bacterium]
MQNIFLEITVIICLAAFFAVVFRWLKQPIILAYILTGIIVGPFGLFNFSDKDVLQLMAQFGITLLLFMVGLELKLSDLKSVGKVSLLTGIGQIVFTSLVGYSICIALGFSLIASLYVSIALTFSSTIIIVKLLSDKRDLHSLYGKISVGFLLVQDFFAILLLIFLAGFNNLSGESLSVWSFVITLAKGAVLFGIVIYLSKTLLPKVVDMIAHSSEALFLFSLAWAFGLAGFVSSPIIGFSVEIGGFLAGLSLANSAENLQIASKIRSLRDFFITIFFVILGMNLTFGNISAILLPAIILSLFVLIGNPIIVMVIMGLLGYRKRTSFLAGLTVAQISEFSLIIIFLGNRLDHLTGEIVTLITVVGIVTFTFSTYMIVNGNKLYLFLAPLLSIFERKHGKKDEVLQSSKDLSEVKNHIVLVGGDQMGESLIEVLEKMNKEIVIIDFDPEIVKKLGDKNIHRLFGDISDTEIKELANVHAAHLIVSTIPDVEDNLILVKEIKSKKSNAVVIVTALDSRDAKMLYEQKADYVVLPHLAGGRQLAKLLEKDLNGLSDLKKKDLAYL